MKYVFFGYMFSNVEKDVKRTKAPPPVSGHKFREGLLRGLIENRQDVAVLNIPRVRAFPHESRVFFPESVFMLDGEARGFNTGFVNLPLVNYLTQSLAMNRHLNKMLKAWKDDTVVLITFNNLLPVNASMVYAKRKYKNTLLCGVIGDLTGENGFGHNAGRSPVQRVKQWIGERADFLSQQFDAFGYLTKYMAEAMGTEEKPFVVIEGMYSEGSAPKAATESKEKRIFYAGTIAKQYGLLHLLKAFTLIQGEEYRLILAGAGDAEQDVKEYVARDGRIVYLGYITPKEVEKYQQSATVLVNPRMSDHAFVKYSFPSKNMECLASGKPYIAHDLICNPEEYREYIQYPTDESDEALARKIVEICELSPEERAAMGERARAFILREKNPQKQCKKIVDMMERIERERSKHSEESKSR